MKYFAYGSNLCLTRLTERISRVKYISNGILNCHQLRFHKRSSRDGSGKANAFETGNSDDHIFGVLFELDSNQKKKLDKHEGIGHGYIDKMVTITLTDGQILNAITYIAEKEYVNDSLLPFSWYLEYLVIGATDFGFPTEYVNYLNSIKTIEDSDPKRLQDFNNIKKKHLKQ